MFKVISAYLRYFMLQNEKDIKTFKYIQLTIFLRKMKETVEKYGMVKKGSQDDCHSFGFYKISHI